MSGNGKEIHDKLGKRWEKQTRAQFANTIKAFDDVRERCTRSQVEELMIHAGDLAQHIMEGMYGQAGGNAESRKTLGRSSQRQKTRWMVSSKIDNNAGHCLIHSMEKNGHLHKTVQFETANPQRLLV